MHSELNFLKPTFDINVEILYLIFWFLGNFVFVFLGLNRGINRTSRNIATTTGQRLLYCVNSRPR